MTLKALKYEHTDNGFCRVYLSRYSDIQKCKLLYAIQDEGERYGGARIYACTRDGEPSHELDAKQFSYPTWEGDTETDKAARSMIAAITT